MSDLFTRSDELEGLVSRGLFKWSDNTEPHYCNVPIPHYCQVPHVRFWGMDIYANAKRPSCDFEAAIHEVGHVVALLGLGLRFECVLLAGKGSDTTGMIIDANPLVPLVGASGPMACSYKKYGNWITWEDSWRDVMQLLLSEDAGKNIPMAIQEAQDHLLKSWNVIEDMTSRLVGIRKLTYAQCLEYSNVSPAENETPVTPPVWQTTKRSGGYPGWKRAS